jgi:hypothetical protein
VEVEFMLWLIAVIGTNPTYSELVASSDSPLPTAGLGARSPQNALTISLLKFADLPIQPRKLVLPFPKE